MSNADFAPLVALLLSFAPPDWSVMRVIYRYEDGVADTQTDVRTGVSKDWQRIGNTGFKMMYFFEEYRGKTHPKMDKPWTTITVTVARENPEPVVEFGYETPNILQR